MWLLGWVGWGLAWGWGEVPSQAEVVLREGRFRFTLDDAGTLIRVERGSQSLEGRGLQHEGEPGAISVRLGSMPLRPGPVQAVALPGGGWSFTYDFRLDPALTAELRVTTARRGSAVALRREVRLRSAGRLGADLDVSMPAWLVALPNESWLPGVDGVGRAWERSPAMTYRAAGGVPGPGRGAEGGGVSVALPLVSFPAAPLAPRVTLFTDPWFSTQMDRREIAWRYPGVVGLEEGQESRRIEWVFHEGGPEQALEAFYGGALGDVPAGPEWLHRIRMAGYDYLSDGGEGWYRDIDALTTALRPSERARVFLCLHGWYDYLGRYCFDAATGRLDREWVAFPEAAQVAKPLPKVNLEGDLVDVSFAQARSVPLTLDAVRARLDYAKRRGFRVGLYFAAGLSAGEGLSGFHPREVLYWGGWQGPDSQGRTYTRNPLVPGVGAFYQGYLRALLAEFGERLDGLVWDETFHVPQGSLGATNGVGPVGYADRAMLRLTDALRAEVDRYNRERRREVAFLVSDCAGMPLGFGTIPTALWAHGTYQDSHFRPGPFGYALFPNYRNVAWSCCWWPMSKWAWVEEGVRRHQAPVPMTNGWGDNLGFAEMSREQRARVLALFREPGRARVTLRWASAGTEGGR